MFGRSQLLCIWLPVLAAVNSPLIAQAKCARPSAALAPPSGPVPPDPVLRLLVPGWRAEPPKVRAHAGGQKVAVTVTADSVTAALKTYRLAVAATLAGPLTVELLGDESAAVQSWSLEVDPHWQAPRSSTAAITTGQEVSQWTCSHTRTRNLHFAATAWAYRVVVAPTAAALTQGQSKSFVVPRAIEQLWHREEKTISSQASVPLGFSSCFGDTFDWTGGSVVAQVLALLPDGSEQPVTRDPLPLDPP